MRKRSKEYPIVIPKYYNPKLKEGEIFGKLKSIKYLYHRAYNKGACSYWLFECACGEKVEFKDISVRNKTTVTCGNQKCLVGLPEGESAFNRLYRTYKTKSSYRDLTFTLTKEEFKKITSSNCSYCNLEPSNCSKETVGNYNYSGIDRVDNTIGYELYNCVSCCKSCNISKNNMTLIEFKEWINRIQKFKSKLIFDESL